MQVIVEKAERSEIPDIDKKKWAALSANNQIEAAPAALQKSSSYRLSKALREKSFREEKKLSLKEEKLAALSIK